MKKRKILKRTAVGSSLVGATLLAGFYFILFVFWKEDQLRRTTLDCEENEYL